MNEFNQVLYNRYEQLSRTRLSQNFILRDFLFSTEAAVCGHSNFPSDDIEQVIESGKQLCSKVLEPILEMFGRFAITFGYQARETSDRLLTDEERQRKAHSSNPHHWDRGRFGREVYCRVDILPFCIEDGLVTKQDFGRWCMANLDIDLLMMWQRSNGSCITVGPHPRRVWIEWTQTGQGNNGTNKIEHIGEDYWTRRFPLLPESERPKFYPSATNGSMRFLNYSHPAMP